MVGYFFWVIFNNKISKNSHYYRTGGKLLIHTFSLNSNVFGAVKFFVCFFYFLRRCKFKFC
jgi:hypothetical protein